MENKGDSRDKDKIISFYEDLSSEDLDKLEKAKQTIAKITKKYNTDPTKLIKISDKDIFIPTSIFKKDLTVLESSVKYLKEEKNYSLRRISKILGRDERNIWHTYSKSKKKYPKKFVIKETEFWITSLLFSNTNLSAQEAIVSYLKEEFSLTYHKIAVLLEKNDRTIWTVYNRAKKKNVGKK